MSNKRLYYYNIHNVATLETRATILAIIDDNKLNAKGSIELGTGADNKMNNKTKQIAILIKI